MLLISRSRGPARRELRSVRAGRRSCRRESEARIESCWLHPQPRFAPLTLADAVSRVKGDLLTGIISLFDIGKHYQRCEDSCIPCLGRKCPPTVDSQSNRSTERRDLCGTALSRVSG